MVIGAWDAVFNIFYWDTQVLYYTATHVGLVSRKTKTPESNVCIVFTGNYICTCIFSDFKRLKNKKNLNKLDRFSMTRKMSAKISKVMSNKE